MQLTLHTDYALRLLLYLKIRDGQPASVNQVADAYGISANHLAKVARRLAALGWVDARRGRGGGLTLAPAADELTVGQVVRRLEHNRRIVECLGDHNTCPIEPACGLKRAFAEAADAFLAVLDGYRLTDLARRPQRLRVLLSISAAGA